MCLSAPVSPIPRTSVASLARYACVRSFSSLDTLTTAHAARKYSRTGGERGCTLCWFVHVISARQQIVQACDAEMSRPPPHTHLGRLATRHTCPSAFA